MLLTTARKGRANVMAMSWHMMIEFEPPLVGCIVSGNDYSFAERRVPPANARLRFRHANWASKVVDVGNSSGRDVDKSRRSD